MIRKYHIINRTISFLALNSKAKRVYEGARDVSELQYLIGQLPKQSSSDAQIISQTKEFLMICAAEVSIGTVVFRMGFCPGMSMTS